MKKKLNKKASSSLELASQMMLWALPKILFLIVFIIIVTAPLGCYSKNRQNNLFLMNSVKSDTYLFELKNCIEKEGLDKDKISKCFNKQEVSALIQAKDTSFIINQDKYKGDFSPESCIKNKCKAELSFLKINNKLEKVSITMVVFNE